MATAGTINVRVAAEVSTFARDMQRATSEVNRFSKSTKDIGQGLQAVGRTASTVVGELHTLTSTLLPTSGALANVTGNLFKMTTAAGSGVIVISSLTKGYGALAAAAKLAAASSLVAPIAAITTAAGPAIVAIGLLTAAVGGLALATARVKPPNVGLTTVDDVTPGRLSTQEKMLRHLRGEGGRLDAINVSAQAPRAELPIERQMRTIGFEFLEAINLAKMKERSVSPFDMPRVSTTPSSQAMSPITQTAASVLTSSASKNLIEKGIGKVFSIGTGVLGGILTGGVSSLIGAGIGSLFGGLFGRKRERVVDHTAEAMERLAKATERVTESISNLPTGIKVAGARFNATDPEGMHIGRTRAPVDTRLVVIQVGQMNVQSSDLASFVAQMNEGAQAVVARGGVSGFQLAIAQTGRGF